MLKWCRLTRLGLKSLLGTLWAMRPECFRGNWDHQARPVSYDMSTSSGICHHNTDYRADTRITHWENNIQTAQPGRPTVFIVLHRQIIQEMSDLWWGTWDFMSGVCLTSLASSQVSLRGKGGEGRSPRHRYHHMTSLKYFWRECYSTLTLLILIQNWVSTFYLTWKTIKTNIETGGKEDCTNHVSHPSLRDITELWLKLNFSCYSLVVVDVCVW